jgi:hypothetical protein
MVNIPMPVTLIINAAALYAAYVMGQMKRPVMTPADMKTWGARKTYLYIAIGLSLGLVVMSGMGGMGGGYGGGGGGYY